MATPQLSRPETGLTPQVLSRPATPCSLALHKTGLTPQVLFKSKDNHHIYISNLSNVSDNKNNKNNKIIISPPSTRSSCGALELPLALRANDTTRMIWVRWRKIFFSRMWLLLTRFTREGSFFFFPERGYICRRIHVASMSIDSNSIR